MIGRAWKYGTGVADAIYKTGLGRRMTWGAGIGAAYGMVSNRETMTGGAITGALYGGAYSTMRTLAGAAGGYGALGRGGVNAWRAGRFKGSKFGFSDYLLALGSSSWKYLKHNYTKAYTPIKALKY